MSKDKLSVKIVQGRTQAAEYLEAFARGLRAGTILMEQGEESMTLCPPEVVNVEVQGKAKKDKQKFILEVAWNTDQDHQAIRITPVDEKTVPVKSRSTIPATKEPASVPMAQKEKQGAGKSAKKPAQPKSKNSASRPSSKNKK